MWAQVLVSIMDSKGLKGGLKCSVQAQIHQKNLELFNILSTSTSISRYPPFLQMFMPMDIMKIKVRIPYNVDNEL